MFTRAFLNELVDRANGAQPQGDRACEVVLRFLAAADGVQGHLQRALASRGCTVMGFEVLTTLRAAAGGPLPPSVIAEQCGIFRGTLTDILARLEACGLVVRHRNPTDRRQLLAELTPKGKKLCEEIVEHYVHAILQIATAIAPESRATMLTVCDDMMRCAAGEAVPAATLSDES
jgi:DNA-binding MarR family transcriptional regulator